MTNNVQTRKLLRGESAKIIGDNTLSSQTQPVPTPKWMFVTGCIVTFLALAYFDGKAIVNILQPDQIVEGRTQLGWKQEQFLGLGILQLACSVVYLIPRTSVLGAILLTGYFGGAVATHARVGDSLHEFAPAIVLGVFVWLGLVLREERFRALLPFRSIR